jgi:serine/threonine-protein kinase
VPVTPPDDVTVWPTEGNPVSPSASPAPKRFAPGSIIAGRYRLVALLGKGGMGEVYRADDLTLDHPVALKFLPEGAASSPASLAQFHNELRVARQVSHKNVCRLYDLGEVDGRRFLTMEYVDGEDLAALIRRIGRIQHDKAIDIARQICAGLAAAHERGVLHRDLKPANVMLDGEGNVRITDFGLALRHSSGQGVVGESDATLAGTPQYMAPEQFAGGRDTIQSDLYALGLVLFEIFTGRRAFEAKTLHELRQQHESGAATPSSVVRDLDPAVERIIMRCLERDPDRRPRSALAVAAALPGANPLAEALAAGETPSPELVATAAEREALPVLRGLAGLAWIVVGLAACAALAPRLTFARLVPLDKPPAVLADRAEQILSALGYTEPHGDTAEGFQVIGDYVDWIGRTDQSSRRWDRLASGSPPALVYWYRTSRRDLVPRQLALRVTPNDPAPNDTDMHMVVLDTRGRLVQFNSVPLQFDPAPADAARGAPWPQLFDAAGLVLASFTPVPPQWTPRDFADVRAAWEGPFPDQPQLRVRVEASAYRNRAVSFNVIGPWSRPTRMQPLTRSTIDRITFAALTIAGGLLIVGAVFLARHNLRAGRADASGATKLAIAAFAIEMTAWVVGFHHVADFRAEMNSFSAIAADAVFVSITLWLMYAAFEPYCRRFWPDMLLGWSRLLSGRFRDPRVGRDVLVGVAAGVAWLLIEFGRRLLPQALGYAPLLLRAGGEATFVGTADAVRLWSVVAILQLTPAFLTVVLFVVLRLVTRRQRAAIALGMLGLFVARSDLGSAPVFWLELVAESLVVMLFTFVMVRFGLLAALVALFVINVCQIAPLTLDIKHWSSVSSTQTLVLVIALALAAFYASRGDQPLFGRFDTDVTSA